MVARMATHNFITERNSRRDSRDLIFNSTPPVVLHVHTRMNAGDLGYHFRTTRLRQSYYICASLQDQPSEVSLCFRTRRGREYVRMNAG